jgi:hypothetical protein
MGLDRVFISSQEPALATFIDTPDFAAILTDRERHIGKNRTEVSPNQHQVVRL